MFCFVLSYKFCMPRQALPGCLCVFCSPPLPLGLKLSHCVYLKSVTWPKEFFPKVLLLLQKHQGFLSLIPEEHLSLQLWLSRHFEPLVLIIFDLVLFCVLFLLCLFACLHGCPLPSLHSPVSQSLPRVCRRWSTITRYADQNRMHVFFPPSDYKIQIV